MTPGSSNRTLCLSESATRCEGGWRVCVIKKDLVECAGEGQRSSGKVVIVPRRATWLRWWAFCFEVRKNGVADVDISCDITRIDQNNWSSFRVKLVKLYDWFEQVCSAK